MTHDTKAHTPFGLNVSQAANYLGVSANTIRRWADAGLLESSRTPGRQRRFTTTQLDGCVRAVPMMASSA